MKHLKFALLVAIVLVSVVSCGKRAAPPVLAPASPTAFDAAPPEIKEMWTQALAASQTNDYYRAEVLLYQLIRQNIPQDQTDAARSQLVSVHNAMVEGEKKGDPAAKAAMEEFKKNPPNRMLPPGSGQ